MTGHKISVDILLCLDDMATMLLADSAKKLIRKNLEIMVTSEHLVSQIVSKGQEIRLSKRKRFNLTHLAHFLFLYVSNIFESDFYYGC